MKAEGVIRKISVGDLKSGITYKIGQPMMGGVIFITSIQLDVDSSEEIGAVKYDIIVKEQGSDYHRIWKSFIGMPVTIEYDIDEERF
jgi:hypothetical protein